MSIKNGMEEELYRMKERRQILNYRYETDKEPVINDLFYIDQWYIIQRYKKVQDGLYEMDLIQKEKDI